MGLGNPNWVPGVSPNPSGKPKEKLWSDAIRMAALEPDDENFNKPKIFRAARKLISMALDGNILAAQEMGNRLQGKPSQEIIQTNINENGIGVLDAFELVGIVGKIFAARGISLPSNLARIGKEETRIISPVCETKVISYEGENVSGKAVSSGEPVGEIDSGGS